MLEYPFDLAATYAAMDRWLKFGGLMSHSIDFSAHVLAVRWNGHWTYPDVVWTLVAGRRSYILNRAPHSMHISILHEYGYTIAKDIITRGTGGVTRAQLARRFASLSDDDLTAHGAFIEAIKIG